MKVTTVVDWFLVIFLLALFISLLTGNLKWWFFAILGATLFGYLVWGSFRG